MVFDLSISISVCTVSFGALAGHSDVFHAVLVQFPIIFTAYKACSISSACRRLHMVSMRGLRPDVESMRRVRFG
jgi:hypothetical protein